MTVHLVGAGPGDAELLTVRAVRLLGRADVVVHDRLIGDEILSWAHPGATFVDVGKAPGGRGTTQERINEILIDAGRRHDCVVRLKGGDPYVFGRGIEELRACTDAGLAVEVVPGITSALAGPMAAGISVTGRNTASGVAVVSAVQDTGSPPIDWAALARSGLTLVVLMGARRAAWIRDRLVEGGLAVDTPVAVVTEATRPTQREARLTLGELGERPVEAPSVLVIGLAAEPARLAALAATPTAVR